LTRELKRIAAPKPAEPFLVVDKFFTNSTTGCFHTIHFSSINESQPFSNPSLQPRPSTEAKNIISRISLLVNTFLKIYSKIFKKLFPSSANPYKSTISIQKIISKLSVFYSFKVKYSINFEIICFDT